MSHGTTILASLDVYPGMPTYASIAAGQHDATIASYLESMNSSAIHYKLPAIYFTFEHEANTPGHHTGLGTPAQFIQAWDHVHQIAVDHHLLWSQGGRIHFVLILTHFFYNNGKAIEYWPGTNEVDIVSADGYNTGGCRIARKQHRPFTFGVTPPESPASLFTGVVHFAAGARRAASVHRRMGQRRVRQQQRAGQLDPADAVLRGGESGDPRHAVLGQPGSAVQLHHQQLVHVAVRARQHGAVTDDAGQACLTPPRGTLQGPADAFGGAPSGFRVKFAPEHSRVV